MRMGWFLPLALLVGGLATQEAWRLRGQREGSRKAGSVALLLFMGWFPLFAWILNNLWPQN